MRVWQVSRYNNQVIALPYFAFKQVELFYFFIFLWFF